MKARWEVLAAQQRNNVVYLARAFDRPGCGEFDRILHSERRFPLRLVKEAPAKSGVVVAYARIMQKSIVLPGIAGPIQFQITQQPELEQSLERLLPGGGANSKFELQHSKLGGLRGVGDRGTIGCGGQGNWLLLAATADGRRDQQ